MQGLTGLKECKDVGSNLWLKWKQQKNISCDVLPGENLMVPERDIEDLPKEDLFKISAERFQRSEKRPLYNFCRKILEISKK